MNLSKKQERTFCIMGQQVNFRCKNKDYIYLNIIR